MSTPHANVDYVNPFIGAVHKLFTIILELSLPTVVRGSDYQIESPKDSIWLKLPMNRALCEFELRLMFAAPAEDSKDSGMVRRWYGSPGLTR